MDSALKYGMLTAGLAFVAAFATLLIMEAELFSRQHNADHSIALLQARRVELEAWVTKLEKECKR